MGEQVANVMLAEPDGVAVTSSSTLLVLGTSK